MEECDAQELFQFLNLNRHSGLSYFHRLGSLRETQVGSHHLEDVQLVKIKLPTSNFTAQGTAIFNTPGLIGHNRQPVPIKRSSRSICARFPVVTRATSSTGMSLISARVWATN